MSATAPRPGYSRQVVPLSGLVLTRDALRLFSQLPGLVVNLVDEHGQSTLISTDAVHLALRRRPATLVVDVVEEETFCQIAMTKISDGLGREEMLRRRLCEQPVAALAADVQGLLYYIDELNMLLDVYALQRRSPAVTRGVRELPRAKSELFDAAAVCSDNVRCSDILRYELRPLLESLGAGFER